jgi:hypothetical protein
LSSKEIVESAENKGINEEEELVEGEDQEDIEENIWESPLFKTE